MEWSGQFAPYLLAAIPALIRMLALVFTLPVISSRHVPLRFRMALAIVMTMAIVPAIGTPESSNHHLASPGFDALQFTMVLLNEALLGASMGIAAQVVLSGARLAGNIIENMSGLSFGLVAGVDSGDEQGVQVLGQLFWWTTLAVFIAAGGANEIMGGVLDSFLLWPAGTAVFDQGLLEFLSAALTNGLEFGLRAALPGILSLLVAGAVLGMIQRNCPQLGGMQASLGLKSMVGLLVTSLLLLSTPWVINGGLENTWQQLQQLLKGG